MKKLFVILFLLTMFLTGQIAHAQTPSPTTNPTGDEEQIEKIKDIVASRVAEMNLVEKRGVIGKVASKTSTQITIEDVRGDKRIMEIDEITKFEDSDNDDFGISDVNTGDEIGVIGLLNKAANRVLARYIRNVTSVPVYFNGVVVDLDTKNFQVHAVDEKGTKRIIDIVPSTKTSSFTKDDGSVKSGFSKIEVGQRVFSAGFMDSKNKNQLNATRVIHFPGLTLSEKLQEQAEKNTTATPTETEEN